MVDAANKDEAFKCLDIAAAALQAGDHARAERFAAKALRLYRCDKTEAMVLRVQVFISERTREGPPSGSGRGTQQAPHSATNGTHQQQQQHHHQQQQRHHSSSSSQHQQQRQQQHAHQQQQQQQRPRGMGGSDGLRHRAAGGARAAAAEPEPPEDPSVTPEQRRVVKTILAATCFYEVLGVARSASDTDIKQAYKKLALRLHPDKNKARKADEAFKLLSRAFSTLSSPDKRAYYDRTGYESSAAAQAAAAGRQQQRGGGGRGAPPGYYYASTTDEFDPEEIFRAFFGGGMFGPQTSRVFRSAYGGGPGFATGGSTRAAPRAPSREEEQQRSQMMALFQILPVLLIVAVTLLSSTADPLYSLAGGDAKFPAQLSTGRLGVAFWVKDAASFDSSYPPGSHKRIALERQVETDVYERVYQRCQHERMAQHRAYTWGNRAAARKMELTSCHELGRLNDAMEAHNAARPARAW